MQELIVVGMRFNQEAYKNARITIGDTLWLVEELDNKVNNEAIAVYSGKYKIGFIRDADLDKVSKYDFTKNYAHYPDSPPEYFYNNIGNECIKDTNLKISRMHKYEYVVDRICTNYLRIKAEVRKDKFNGIKNPCCEINFGTNSGSQTNCDSVTYSRDTLTGVLKNKAVEALNETNSKKPIGGTLPNQHKEEKKMINTTAMRDSFFKEVKNVAMDMQTGKLGVVTKDGIITATDEGVSVNPITEMGFNIPAFAMRVPIEQLVKGDIIIGSGDPVFFMEGSKVGYMTISTNGVLQETGSVANMFFGKNTVMAVKNMFGGDSNSMNPMLMMAMMGDDKEGSGFDFKKMMMMQMMMGQNGGSNQMNPMMMAMMMGAFK